MVERQCEVRQVLIDAVDDCFGVPEYDPATGERSVQFL
jgi:hypothetical protein